MNCLKVSDPDSQNRIRSWSSSHVDSVGDSNHSRQSMDSNDTWRRIRLQQIFFKAVIDNDLEIAVRCLHHGADVAEEYQPYSQTVLHQSAQKGFLRMTELLLRAGANPNTLDEKSFLPLHYACQEGHFHTVRCLLFFGSMVSIENEYGDAPIHTATRYGHLDIIPLLLSIELKRDFGAREVPDHLQGIYHLNLQNANGDTPLHIASALDRKAIVKKILLWGADQSIPNRQGFTPLQVALERQHTTIVKLLKTPSVVLSSHEAFAMANSFRDSGRFTTSESNSYPFKSMEGLQKYTEDTRRLKNDIDGIPRSYLDHEISQMSPPSVEIENVHKQSQVDGRSESFRNLTVRPIQPNEIITNGHFIKRRPLGTNGSQRLGPSKKLMEREALPNNLNDSQADDMAFRISHLQSYGRRSASDYLLARSMDDKLNLADDRGRHRQRRHEIPSSHADRKLDALSLEVNSKLKQIDSKYHEFSAKENEFSTSTTTSFAAAANHNKRSSSAKASHRCSKTSRNEAKQQREQAREASQIKITFGPSNPTENFILTASGNQRISDTNGSVANNSTRTIRCSSIPPAPLMPQDHNRSVDETWMRGDQLLVMKNSTGPDAPSSSASNPTNPTPENQEVLLNTKVLSEENGEKVINPAPKISDIYGVGHVSPKIRQLQNQLRRSQMKTASYEMYVEDYVTK